MSMSVWFLRECGDGMQWSLRLQREIDVEKADGGSSRKEGVVFVISFHGGE